MVKTTESFIGKVGGGKNLIKTLRFYDSYNGFRLMDEILIEQVKCFTLNKSIETNFISVVQNGFKIYFWRRHMQGNGEAKLQLYVYDFDQRMKEI
jgi:hypothetical protein